MIQPVNAACSLQDLKRCNRQEIVSILTDLIKNRQLNNKANLVKFQATEIISNKPERIEFWTQAYCPDSGTEYDYKYDYARYFLLSCEKGAEGSHGGCKTCVMSKIVLQERPSNILQGKLAQIDNSISMEEKKEIHNKTGVHIDSLIFKGSFINSSDEYLVVQYTDSDGIKFIVLDKDKNIIMQDYYYLYSKVSDEFNLYDCKKDKRSYVFLQSKFDEYGISNLVGGVVSKFKEDSIETVQDFYDLMTKGKVEIFFKPNKEINIYKWVFYSEEEVKSADKCKDNSFCLKEITDIYGDKEAHLIYQYTIQFNEDTCKFEIKKDKNTDSYSDLTQNRKNELLLYFTQKGNLKKVQELVSASADVNAKNSEKETALMIASEYGWADIVKELIKKKANINENNENGTALTYAFFLGAEAYEGELLKKYDKGNNNLSGFASYKEHLSVVKELIKSGIDINFRNELYGRTALMYAVERGIYLEEVKELILAGADLNGKDNNKDTALVIAQRMHNLDMQKLLKDAGAEDEF
ncbi:MAG: ankyrin repeat domain-containing protein [Candidatus Pacebacteria bacterium]|nr:ankyrin repeat domain-containing protein [Candidatus Paceibacterota bacterium]